MLKKTPEQSSDSTDEQSAALGDLPVWRLDDLYTAPDSPELESDLQWTATECEKFAEDYRGKLADLDGAGMLAALQRYEAIQCRLHRIGIYAHLRVAQNTLDADRIKLASDIDTRTTEITRPLIFFTLELNRVDDAVLERQLAESEELGRYREWFRRLRAFRPHQLDDQLEEYIHDTNQISSAWVVLFDEATAAWTFQVEGEELNLERTLNLLLDPERSKRQAAAEALSQTFAEHIRFSARVMNTIVKEKEIDDRWRKYPAPQSARHLSNAIEPEIVQALRDAVVESYPQISHRYYALKARWLGLEQLETWDRNAPVPGASDRVYGWDEARDIVLGAYGDFSPAFGSTAAQFFERGWIDAPTAQGKASGAFSAPGPSDRHPFVLLNYLGRTRDVMTLAHELGHGVHQCLAAGQGELLASTPLTFAETASVFGEMLTFRRLLASETDPLAKRAMLANKAEDMINTVVRQISFYDFESKLHDARKAGELTPDAIGELWLSVATESLGPAFQFRDGYENYWSYVHHFIHTPFYVYAYAFGDGLVNALYARYEAGDDSFVEKYLAMLQAGGSCGHQELLQPFGIDLRDPEFWHSGLQLIGDTISAAEALSD